MNDSTNVPNPLTELDTTKLRTELISGLQIDASEAALAVLTPSAARTITAGEGAAAGPVEIHHAQRPPAGVQVNAGVAAGRAIPHHPHVLPAAAEMVSARAAAHIHRRTKIIATVGPASWDAAVLERLAPAPASISRWTPPTGRRARP